MEVSIAEYKLLVLFTKSTPHKPSHINVLLINFYTYNHYLECNSILDPLLSNTMEYQQALWSTSKCWSGLSPGRSYRRELNTGSGF